MYLSIIFWPANLVNAEELQNSDSRTPYAHIDTICISTSVDFQNLPKHCREDYRKEYICCKPSRMPSKDVKRLSERLHSLVAHPYHLELAVLDRHFRGFLRALVCYQDILRVFFSIIRECQLIIPCISSNRPGSLILYNGCISIVNIQFRHRT